MTIRRVSSNITMLTTPQAATLSNEEILRYSRHLIMPEVGMEGQQKLKAARVLCVGTGGLGSPLALYLAAAGVGTLGLVDFDVVDLTNLQRQIIHTTADVGRPKLDSAAEKLAAINPFIEIRKFETKLSSANALDIIRQFDIVADGSLNIINTGSSTNDTVHLTGAVTVANDLNITSGALDITSNNYAINIDGGFYNWATFNCEAGTLTFQGSGAQYFRPGGSNYYNTVFNNTGNNSVTLQNDLNNLNNLTISGGTLDVSLSNYNIVVDGNFNNNASFNAESGTLTFWVSAAQTFNPGSSNYYNIIVYAWSGSTVTLTEN